MGKPLDDSAVRPHRGATRTALLASPAGNAHLTTRCGSPPPSPKAKILLPKMASEPGQGKIVICGSMSQYGCMLDIQSELNDWEIKAIVPADETTLPRNLSPKQFFAFKRAVSERYFRTIRQRDVLGILVANNPKHGIDNYIGANTFAEVAIAVNAKKKVYLLNDYYEPVKDELVAWEAVPLYGKLEKVIHEVLSLHQLAAAQLQFHLPEPTPKETYAHVSREG